MCSEDGDTEFQSIESVIVDKLACMHFHRPFLTHREQRVGSHWACREPYKER